MSGLPAYLQRYAYEKRLETARDRSRKPLWEPFPNSPQRTALESKADVLLMGGAAGGGKTDVLIGAAFTQHKRSIIFRREFPQLKGIIARGDEILQAGKRDARYVAGEVKAWRFDNRVIELGAIQYEKDLNKYQGRPFDLVCFDEAAHFSEKMIRWLLGWNRTSDPNQRVRAILASNPPTDPTGEWLIDYFAPWLDPEHENPAEPGELRWFVTHAGRDIEVESEHAVEIEGETLTPKSRTFIPSRIEDNPVYMATGYRAQLEALPDELRIKLLYGVFSRDNADHANQVIPTAWLQAAMNRWEAQSTPETEIVGVSIDVARGGNDRTAFAVLRGAYIDLYTHEGHETPNSQSVLDLLDSYTNRNRAVRVVVDAIGVGAAVVDTLRAAGYEVEALNNSSGVGNRTDKSNMFGFINLRAASYWHLREVLDPESRFEIAIPNDHSLMRELRAVTYTVTTGKYKLKAKEDISKVLGRSPDAADAIVMLVETFINSRQLIYF